MTIPAVLNPPRVMRDATPLCTCGAPAVPWKGNHCCSNRACPTYGDVVRPLRAGETSWPIGRA